MRAKEKQCMLGQRDGPGSDQGPPFARACKTFRVQFTHKLNRLEIEADNLLLKDHLLVSKHPITHPLSAANGRISFLSHFLG